MVNTAKLNELATRLGIWLSYTDPEGKEHTASCASKQAVCRALGYSADTDNQIVRSLKALDAQEFADFVPPCLVIPAEQMNPLYVPVVLPKSQQEREVSWVLTREDGTSDKGSFIFEQHQLLQSNDSAEKRSVALILDAPCGYHTLSFLGPKVHAQMQLIITPKTCYMPDVLSAGGRVWGIPVQLYALKSAHNWGMGDFTDLKNLAPITHRLGASLVGINPLNALFLDTPKEASPYAASSRVFLNPLYIDPDAVEEAGESQEYQAYKQSPRFQELLAYCRASETVEYDYLTEMKLTALGLLFDTFKAIHLTADYQAATPKGHAFLDFCADYGEDLEWFATYQVLRQSHICGQKTLLWWRWEEECVCSDSAFMKAFRVKYASAIWFMKYLQFVAFTQFENAGKSYLDEHFSIGLYGDLPVSVNLNSSEVWAHQELFLRGVSAGAPPDIFNKKGQDWALAAFNPFTLKRSGYHLFRTILQAIMRPCGAVRIDHAFGLMRLYLQAGSGRGAYLSYPFQEMMGIIALESQRNKCLVIAEDLGVPPPDFHALMRGYATLSFRLLRYQKQGESFLPPTQYERFTLITAGTHDMPTYAAFWQGEDITLYRDLKLISKNSSLSATRYRVQERLQFVQAFKDAGLDIPDISPTELTGEDLPAWFIPGAYTFLAKSPSLLLLVRLEDVLEQVEQVNLPGTFLEYPNWRYKITVDIEGLEADDRVQLLCSLLREQRPL